MKRIIATALLLILSLMLVTGCTKKTDIPEGMKEFQTSDNLEYNIYMPESWIQDLSTGAVSAYCSTTDISNFSMTVFSLEDVTKTLEDETESYINDLKGLFNDFEMAEDYPEQTVLGASKASKLVYKASLAGNTYKYMQLLCIRGGNLYVFTYTAMEDKFESHIEEIEKVLNNFSFR